MTAPLNIDSGVQDLAVGLVVARGVTIGLPEAALVQQCRAAANEVLAQGPEGGDDRRQAVRGLLRRGGYKPSGRNKPAQEYLLRAAGPGGAWPTIYNAVDVLNVVSLRSGLPISLVALSRLQAPLAIRYGRPGESFVFNQAGQSLAVEGLLCVCHTACGHSQPVGSPVKDSQFAKVTTSDTHVLACIFAPQSSVAVSGLQFWVDELAAGLSRWCQPDAVDTWLVPDNW